MANIETVISRRTTGCAQLLVTGDSLVWRKPLHMLPSGLVGNVNSQMYDLGYNYADDTCKMRQGHEIMAQRMKINVVIDPYDYNAATADLAKANATRRVTYQVRVMEYTPCVSNMTLERKRKRDVPDNPDHSDWIRIIREGIRIAMRNRFRIFNGQSPDTPKTPFGQALNALYQAVIDGQPRSFMHPKSGGLRYMLNLMQTPANAILHSGATLQEVQDFITANSEAVHDFTMWFEENWLGRYIVKQMSYATQFTWSGASLSSSEPGYNWAPWLLNLCRQISNPALYTWVGPNYLQQSPSEWVTNDRVTHHFDSLENSATSIHTMFQHLFNSDDFGDYVYEHYRAGGTYPYAQTGWGTSVADFLKSLAGVTNWDEMPDDLSSTAGLSQHAESQAKITAAFNGLFDHFKLNTGPTRLSATATAMKEWSRVNVNPYPQPFDSVDVAEHLDTEEAHDADTAHVDLGHTPPAHDNSHLTMAYTAIVVHLLQTAMSWYHDTHSSSRHQLSVIETLANQAQTTSTETVRDNVNIATH